MAWFGHWFSKKNSTSDGFVSDSEIFDQGQAGKIAAAPIRSASERKSIRIEQRELLYAVVRESMSRIGLITSSYKYKVLSLDSQGRQYLIMIDMKLDAQNQTPLMSKIEHLVARDAMAQHGIQVTGVYWRFSVPNSLDDNKQSRPETRVEPDASATDTPATVKPSAVNPVDTKQELLKALSKPREHHEAKVSAFPDTMLLDHEAPDHQLSNTQLGTLN